MRGIAWACLALLVVSVLVYAFDPSGVLGPIVGAGFLILSVILCIVVLNHKCVVKTTSPPQ
jgi:hypothetical protein